MFVNGHYNFKIQKYDKIGNEKFLKSKYFTITTQ